MTYYNFYDYPRTAKLGGSKLLIVGYVRATYDNGEDKIIREYFVTDQYPMDSDILEAICDNKLISFRLLDLQGSVIQFSMDLRNKHLTGDWIWEDGQDWMNQHELTNQEWRDQEWARVEWSRLMRTALRSFSEN